MGWNVSSGVWGGAIEKFILGAFTQDTGLKPSKIEKARRAASVPQLLGNLANASFVFSVFEI